MNMLCGYMVLRSGQKKIQGSARCILKDQSAISIGQSVDWVKESIRKQWRIPETDEIVVMGFMPV